MSKRKTRTAGLRTCYLQLKIGYYSNWRCPFLAARVCAWPYIASEACASGKMYGLAIKLLSKRDIRALVSIGDRSYYWDSLYDHRTFSGAEGSDDRGRRLCWSLCVDLAGGDTWSRRCRVAGSVVTMSVPPMTVVQGNPAKQVARCGIPLGLETSRTAFMRQLKKIK